ncbi:RsmD family RNA methyltransferase [Spirochaeta dissipatitropha]
MRITAGTYRGRRVNCPPGVIRPAMDRMRESLFSCLGPIEGRSFLDLFSGSGVMGIEAASRGADPIRLVEKDVGKKKVMLQNIAMCEEEIRISFMPVERFIKSWKESYDLLYLDPPFDYPFKQQLLERLLNSRLMKHTSRILIHYPREDRLTETIIPAGHEAEGYVGKKLVRYDLREYGRSMLGMYEVSD